VAAIAALPQGDVEADDGAGIGDHGAVRAGVVADLESTLDHGDGALAVGQHGQHFRLVHQLGLGHADVHVDHHGLQRLAQSSRDRKGVVPERVAQRPACRLGRIAAADVGAHADLQHHALLGHRLSSTVKRDFVLSFIATGLSWSGSSRPSIQPFASAFADRWILGTSPRMTAKPHVRC